MHAFAQKPRAPHQTALAKSTLPGQARLGHSREGNAILPSRRAITTDAAGATATNAPRFSFDLSRIPAHAPVPARLQTKLAMSTPGDVYEQEADRVAEQTMGMPEARGASACPTCQNAQDAHEHVQTKRVQADSSGGTAAPPIVHEVLRSPGQPLDRTTTSDRAPKRDPDPRVVRRRTIGNQVAPQLLQTNSESVAPTMNSRPTEPSATALPASGEMAGGGQNEGEDWLPTTGDDNGVGRGGTLPYREATNLLECMRIMGDEAYCRQTVLGEAPGLAPPQAILQKTTVSGPSTRNNGGFSWGSRWSLQNATASTNGWIVQHVAVTQNVTDAAGTAVVTGQGGFGGLSTSWYPLWEGWQVRGGQVFIGGGNSPHGADTYAQAAVGANTQGTTSIAGRANFYPNLTLPVSFTVRNAAPAWALPVTNTDPAVIGGTGPLSHSLTATWDGVIGNGATTLTTV